MYYIMMRRLKVHFHYLLVLTLTSSVVNYCLAAEADYVIVFGQALKCCVIECTL